MMRLSSREKSVVIAGGVFLLAVLFFNVIWMPVVSEKKRLEKQVAEGEKKIHEMMVMQERYQRLAPRINGKGADASLHEKGFTLFSFLDRLARKSGVKENIVHMKPGSRKDDGPLAVSMVKVKMDSLYLKELIDFLYLLETVEKGVHVSGISLSRTGKDTPLLDAVLDVWTLVTEDAS